MEPRLGIRERFVTSFHFGDRPIQVSNEQLDALERELDTRLPDASRQFITRYGAVHTPRILDEIVARNIQHPDVQDFLLPKDSIANTRGYWSGGMPEDVIGVASVL